MEKGSRVRRKRAVYIEYLEKRIAPATFVVTNLNDAGEGSLRDAVDSANASPGADTIVFKGAAKSGELALSSGDIDITDSVNIKGPGAGKLIIDAQDLSRIFDIDDGTDEVKRVTISGLSMVDGNSGAEDGGGGIRSRESLTLINSVISGCTGSSTDGGGAIYIATLGKLAVRNSKLTGNASEGPGGAVIAAAQGGVEILSTLIADNSSSGDGGGLFLIEGTEAAGDLVIERSTIIHNSGQAGGGIWAENDRRGSTGEVIGKITVRDTDVSGNSARTSGGGAYLSSGLVLLERDLFANNTAVVAGGGVSSKNHDSLTVRKSEILKNHTTDSYGLGGGGIFNEGSLDVLIQRTLIAGNTAAGGDGGGIRATFSELTIQSSTLSGNTSVGSGGGVFTYNGIVNILNSTVRGNQALNSGGGIFNTNSDGDILRIVNSLFSNNRSGDAGGGVGSTGDGRVDILTSRFVQNVAGSSGGGLYLRSNLEAISIVRSVIAQNTVAGDGGGVALRGSTAPVTITNTVIRGNFAGDDGGGISLFDGTLRVVNSTVSDNIAASQGGGLWSESDIPLAVTGSKVTGNIAPSGPQIYEQFTS